MESYEEIEIYAFGKQIDVRIAEKAELPTSITIYDAASKEYKRIEQIGNLPYRTIINMQTAVHRVYI